MARDLWESKTWSRMSRERHSWFSIGNRAGVGKLWLGCLITVWAAVLIPSPGFAKPKLDIFGNCVLPSKCTSNSIDATCAKLYCRGLKEKCDGDYSSGKCKDIKDLHTAGNCSLAKSGCGDTLPRILTIGSLQVDISDGEVFVVTDPENDAVDFSEIFDAAAASVALLDPKTCLDKCLSRVSKECAAACRAICAPEQY